MIPQAIFAMKPVRALMFVPQRLFRANENRDTRTAELRGVQRISRGLPHIHVSSHGGNRQHTNIRRTQRHNQRNGVVRSRVGINQKRGFHGPLA